MSVSKRIILNDDLPEMPISKRAISGNKLPFTRTSLGGEALRVCFWEIVGLEIVFYRAFGQY